VTDGIPREVLAELRLIACERHGVSAFGGSLDSDSEA
jgi:hypothetical protein